MGFFLILTHLLNGKKGAFIQQTTDKGFTSAAVSNVCKTVPELLERIILREDFQVTSPISHYR